MGWTKLKAGAPKDPSPVATIAALVPDDLRFPAALLAGLEGVRLEPAHDLCVGRAKLYVQVSAVAARHHVSAVPEHPEQATPSEFPLIMEVIYDEVQREGRQVDTMAIERVQKDLPKVSLYGHVLPLSTR